MDSFLKKEIERLIKGYKKIGIRKYNLPSLKMDVTLKKGVQLKTFLRHYIIDRNGLTRNKKL